MSGTDPLAAWRALLDSFDAELAASEPAPDPAPDAAPTPRAWHPPAGLGPIPAALRERARTIAAAQAARVEGLRRELAGLRAHLDALALIPAERSDAAAYLDRDG